MKYSFFSNFVFQWGASINCTKSSACFKAFSTQYSDRESNNIPRMFKIWAKSPNFKFFVILKKCLISRFSVQIAVHSLSSKILTPSGILISTVYGPKVTSITQTLINSRHFSSAMLCILTSERMLAHAFAGSKTIKNALKLSKTYLFHHAYVRLM